VPELNEDGFTSLLEVREQRYGVIVGVGREATNELAANLRNELERRFPGVTFCIVAGASSVAFPLPDEA
jgi:hypothetical protein